MISLRDVVTGFGNRDPLAEVWRRNLRGSGGGSAVITGVPPLRYIGDGRPLTDYMIAGNAVQNGTPSADAPVDAVGSGVRTGNLARYWKAAYVTSEGSINANRVNGLSYPVKIEKDQTVSFSNQKPNFGRGLAVFRTFDGADLSDMAYRSTNNINVYTADEDCYAVIWGNYDNTTSMDAEVFDLCGQMLNAGSTALPYEPYGFKLPLTVNGVEHPIYLGTVPTTRRVKKLVLTGEERLTIPSISLRVPIGAYIPCIAGYVRGVINTHFITNDTSETTPTYTNAYTTRLGAAGGVTWFFIPRAFFSGELSVENCIAEFKAWLAAQYANGTPVTVWYVLAEPETAIVNEPLMKIGDYADTISFAQAQVTIPTVNGENVLDVPATVPPSEITIKGGISSV